MRMALLALALVSQTTDERPTSLLASRDWHGVTLAADGTALKYQCLSLRPGAAGYTSGQAWFLWFDASEQGHPVNAVRGKYQLYKGEGDDIIVKLAFTRKYRGDRDDAGYKWTIDRRYDEEPTGVSLEVSTQDGKLPVNPVTFVAGRAFWTSDAGDERSLPKGARLRDIFSDNSVSRTRHIEVGETFKLSDEGQKFTSFIESPPPGFLYR